MVRRHEFLVLSPSATLCRPIQVHLAFFAVRETSRVRRNQSSCLLVEVSRHSKRRVLHFSVSPEPVDTLVFAYARVHELVEALLVVPSANTRRHHGRRLVHHFVKRSGIFALLILMFRVVTLRRSCSCGWRRHDGPQPLMRRRIDALALGSKHMLETGALATRNFAHTHGNCASIHIMIAVINTSLVN